MKRGAKRAATSDPGAFAAADLPSKRVMDRPSFDVHRAESSHQHVMAGPASLDTQRAEAASKHVRALNTQFASWVQSQLQDHPAELWVDGVKDYISHASEIMEKFKDVVDWLRKNKVGSYIVSKPSSLKDEKTSSGVSSTHSSLEAEKAAPDAVSTPSSPKDEENTVSVTKGSKVMVQPNTNGGLTSPTTAFSSSAFQKSSSQNIFSFSSGQKMPAFTGIFGDNKNMPGDSNKFAEHFGLNNGSSPPTVPAIVSVTSSQSPALFPVSQQPVFPGNENTAEAPCDGDEDAEPEQPSSPSVKKTEEKGVVVVHEAKCKVYVKHDDATKGWKDIGVGQLSIRSKEGAVKASKESMPTIVIRNDVGKILLNALIYKGIKMNIQKNTVASIFHTSGGGQSCDSGSGTVVARTYLFRLKNEAAASELAAAIKENAPSD